MISADELTPEEAKFLVFHLDPPPVLSWDWVGEPNKQLLASKIDNSGLVQTGLPIESYKRVMLFFDGVQLTGAGRLLAKAARLVAVEG